MRKLVSIGLLAVSTVLATQSVFAYDIEMCEEFKGGTPGLYGLCRAFVNAGNDNARRAVEQNYTKRRAPDDPVSLQDFFDGVGDFVCPCFDALDLSIAATRLDADRVECGTIGNPDDSSYDFFDVHDENVIGETRIEAFSAGELFAGFYFCENANALFPLDFILDLSAETADACIELMNAARLVLADEGIDCTEIPEAP